MRVHHAIAVVAVILIGFGVKLFFFSAPAAEAQLNLNPITIDVLQMHRDYPNLKGLPVQVIKADLM